MGARGRPPAVVELSESERETLTRWARRHTSAQSVSLRARIVLACDEGLTNDQIADRERCSPATVSKWRRRFATDRIKGLADAPRAGAPRKISDDVVEKVIVDALETTPGADTHWSTRGMAARHGISRESVGRIWRAFGLTPHVVDEFKISPDPFLVEKIRDIVALYMSPPLNAACFAVDEKPQIQALNRTAPILPMLPTTPERQSHDYVRNGTIDLFAAMNLATGEVITDLRPDHTAKQFIRFLNKINRNVPPELDVHLVLDNLSTHKTPAVHKWLLRHKRFHLHFTPTYGSWMNLVERWFSALTTKKLRRSSHDSVKQLAADIKDWVEHWNENPKPFVWTKTADEILERLGRYCDQINPPNNNQRNSVSGHGVLGALLTTK